MPLKNIVLAGLLLGLTAGCASIHAVSDKDKSAGPYAYRGVQTDIALMGLSLCEGHGCVPLVVLPFALIDLPLSMVMDTILLPFTLTRPSVDIHSRQAPAIQQNNSSGEFDSSYCKEFGVGYNQVLGKWEKCR
ncbi:MAG: YceK/YidQ family lipoprotein [Gammaproteobacteria bacterium]|nr:YceK/YidQ family lipoprotein [Gammaproteobacteria bacterium]MDH5654039.1 YceK/YidQ family lipoprotein [Gammaproteobacteria bacterium]